MRAAASSPASRKALGWNSSSIDIPGHEIAASATYRLIPTLGIVRIGLERTRHR
jgi:hypothetical protein